MSELRRMIAAKDHAYKQTPQIVFLTAEFMRKIGIVKTKPVSWKDSYFPEVLHLPGD